jgi:hypothetical protein
VRDEKGGVKGIEECAEAGCAEGTRGLRRLVRNTLGRKAVGRRTEAVRLKSFVSYRSEMASQCPSSEIAVEMILVRSCRS